MSARVKIGEGDQISFKGGIIYKYNCIYKNIGIFINKYKNHEISLKIFPENLVIFSYFSVFLFTFWDKSCKMQAVVSVKNIHKIEEV